MLRVVLDANIYISAFISPDGRNHILWRAASERRYLLLVSPPIVAEVADVLRRDFDWPEIAIQHKIKKIAAVAQIVPVSAPLTYVIADPSDNCILECAINGKADLIVSNDHHLLDLKTCEGIPIVASPDFRRTLGLR